MGSERPKHPVFDAIIADYTEAKRVLETTKPRTYEHDVANAKVMALENEIWHWVTINGEWVRRD